MPGAKMSAEAKMFNFTLKISIPALDRLVDFLVKHFDEQLQIDALTAQFASMRAELNTSTATLADAIAKPKQ